MQQMLQNVLEVQKRDIVKAPNDPIQPLVQRIDKQQSQISRREKLSRSQVKLTVGNFTIL